MSAYLFNAIFRILVWCGLGVLIAILINKLRNIEPEARSFMYSMIIYFVFEVVGTIFIFIYNNLANFVIDVSNPALIWNVVGQLIVLLGPVYLIFVLEKRMFEKPLIKEKHVVTILEVVLFVPVVVGGLLIFYGIFDFNLFFILIVGFMGLQGIFFSFGFLYLGLKTPGAYRKNALLVSFGYSIRLGASAFAGYAVFQYNQGFITIDPFLIMLGINQIVSFIGIVVLTYGLLKLYK
ncbi:MAG: hypothetical protein HWN65_13410 [Candidatus Helarchaeota archaeon]|nr:hypothetical protein [Candidatus Helarchaeota archaeon]